MVSLGCITRCKLFCFASEPNGSYRSRSMIRFKGATGVWRLPKSNASSSCNVCRLIATLLLVPNSTQILIASTTFKLPMPRRRSPAKTRSRRSSRWSPRRSARRSPRRSPRRRTARTFRAVVGEEVSGIGAVSGGRKVAGKVTNIIETEFTILFDAQHSFRNGETVTFTPPVTLPNGRTTNTGILQRVDGSESTFTLPVEEVHTFSEMWNALDASDDALDEFSPEQMSPETTRPAGPTALGQPVPQPSTMIGHKRQHLRPVAQRPVSLRDGDRRSSPTRSFHGDSGDASDGELDEFSPEQMSPETTPRPAGPNPLSQPVPQPSTMFEHKGGHLRPVAQRPVSLRDGDRRSSPTRSFHGDSGDEM